MTNDILGNRFKECGITKEDILKQIKSLDDKSTVFIYSSHLEGLGTKSSDFDIYVISDTAKKIETGIELENCTLSRAFLNGIALDIEYWKTDDISDLIIDINNVKTNANLDIENLKLLHRLKISEIIFGEEKGSEIKETVRNSKLTDHALGYYTLESRSFLEDSIALYKSKEFECAFASARNALFYAMGAYNVKCGITNLKEKWIPKIINKTDNDQEITERCLGYLIYSKVTKDNIAEETEELIDFINELLTKISLM